LYASAIFPFAAESLAITLRVIITAACSTDYQKEEGKN